MHQTSGLCFGMCACDCTHPVERTKLVLQSEEGRITSSWPFFVFYNFVQQKGLELREKVNYLRLFNNPLSKYLIFQIKSYLPNLKKGLGLAFGKHSLNDFSIKMFLI